VVGAGTSDQMTEGDTHDDEHTERQEEPEVQEAAVLPAREAISLITEGGGGPAREGVEASDH
jgi:hypothetical protein